LHFEHLKFGKVTVGNLEFCNFDFGKKRSTILGIRAYVFGVKCKALTAYHPRRLSCFGFLSATAAMTLPFHRFGGCHFELPHAASSNLKLSNTN
jgi:hypothetical protein